MKECRICKTIKPLESFSKRADYKDGYFTRCKACDKDYTKQRMELMGDKIRSQKKEYRENNKEHLSNFKKDWYKENKDYVCQKVKKHKAENFERYSEIQKIYYVKNKSKIRKVNKTWADKNRDRCNSYGAKYRANAKKATPVWLTEEHYKEMEEFYTLAKDLSWLFNGEPLEVDHIVPLQGKEVCGLHVPWNLQILTESNNCKKSNKLFK